MNRITLSLIFSMCFFTLQAQLSLPPSGNNQKSIVTQYIGPLAHVTIKYHSPDVTGPNGQSRKGQIWGQLVPYGFNQQVFGLNNPAPWRAGANECTVIKLSHDVVIEGKPLAAGKYSLFIAPEESGPWTIIFNKNTEGWGSYFYEEKDDVLRVQVEPKEAEYHEWLTYEFADRQPNSTVAAMVWENKRLPFKIEVPNNNELVVENLKGELQGSLGFTWTNFNSAANFCLQNNVDLEQGLKWADQAINPPIGTENFATLSTKGQLLAATGKTQESLELMEKAVKHNTATVFQIHGYGRQLIGAGQKEKALDIFKYNMERFGDVWPVRVGLARGYAAIGKYDKALEHAKIAHDRAPDDLNKNGLANAIEKLKKNEDIN